MILRDERRFSPLLLTVNRIGCSIRIPKETEAKQGLAQDKISISCVGSGASVSLGRRWSANTCSQIVGEEMQSTPGMARALAACNVTLPVC